MVVELALIVGDMLISFFHGKLLQLATNQSEKKLISIYNDIQINKALKKIAKNTIKNTTLSDEAKHVLDIPTNCTSIIIDSFNINDNLENPLFMLNLTNIQCDDKNKLSTEIKNFILSLRKEILNNKKIMSIVGDKLFQQCIEKDIDSIKKEIDKLNKRIASFEDKNSKTDYHIRENCLEPVHIFIGRDKELEELKKSVSENNITYICGQKGIGKSELCRKFIQDCKKINNELKFIWLYYNESIKNTICSNHFICNLSESDYDNIDDLFQKKLDILSRENVITIIDNYETGDDDDLTQFNQLHFKKIYISYQNIGLNPIIINELDLNQSIKLLENYSNHSKWIPEHRKDVEQLLKNVNCHTYFIVLLGGYLKNSPLCKIDVEKILSIGKGVNVPVYKDGSTKETNDIQGYIIELFNLSELNKIEIQILQILSVLPPSDMDKKEFFEFAEIYSPDEINAFNHLESLNLISSDEYVSSHTLIKETIIYLKKPTLLLHDNDKLRKIAINILEYSTNNTCSLVKYRPHLILLSSIAGTGFMSANIFETLGYSYLTTFDLESTEKYFMKAISIYDANSVLNMDYILLLTQLATVLYRLRNNDMVIYEKVKKSFDYVKNLKTVESESYIILLTSIIAYYSIIGVDIDDEYYDEIDRYISDNKCDSEQLITVYPLLIRYFYSINNEIKTYEYFQKTKQYSLLKYSSENCIDYCIIGFILYDVGYYKESYELLSQSKKDIESLIVDDYGYLFMTYSILTALSILLKKPYETYSDMLNYSIQLANDDTYRYSSISGYIALARSLQLLSRSEESITYYKKIINNYYEYVQEDALLHIYDQITNIYINLNEKKNAFEYNKKAIEIYEKNNINDWFLNIKLYVLLGQEYYDEFYDEKQAFELLSNSYKKYQEKKFGTYNTEYTRIFIVGFNTLCKLCYKKGQIEECIDIYNDVKEIKKRINEIESTTDLLKIGILNYINEEYCRASNDFCKIMIDNLPISKEDEAKRLYYLGETYRLTSEIEIAIDYYIESIEICRNNNIDNLLLENLCKLAMAYDYQNDTKLSEDIIETAFEIYDEKDLIDDGLLMTLYATKGLHYNNPSTIELFDKYCTKATEIYAKNNKIPQHYRVILLSTLIEMSSVFKSIGNYMKSAHYCLMAIKNCVNHNHKFKLCLELEKICKNLNDIKTKIPYDEEIFKIIEHRIKNVPQIELDIIKIYGSVAKELVDNFEPSNNDIPIDKYNRAIKLADNIIDKYIKEYGEQKVKIFFDLRSSPLLRDF